MTKNDGLPFGGSFAEPFTRRACPAAKFVFVRARLQPCRTVLLAEGVSTPEAAQPPHDVLELCSS